MNEDQRSYKRIPIHLHVTGKLPDGTSFTGQVSDMTPQGLAFIIESNIEIEEQFELEVHLGEGEKTCFRCQVVRIESLAEDTLEKVCAKIIYAAPADNMRLYQFYKKMRERIP